MESGPPERLPGSVCHSPPFPLHWQRIAIQPRPLTKMSCVQIGESVSVSTTARLLCSRRFSLSEHLQDSPLKMAKAAVVPIYVLKNATTIPGNLMGR